MSGNIGKYPIVGIIRNHVVQRLMRTDCIVVFDIAVYELPEFSRGGKLIGVYGFCFQTSEPTLYHDVVSPASLAIHALTDPQFFQQMLVIIACELATLVRI